MAGGADDARRLLLDSPLFDEEWYALVTRASGDRSALVDHYLSTPIARRASPQPLFDPAWFADRLDTESHNASAGAEEADAFVDYLRRRPHSVRTSPLLVDGFVRRPAAQRHPHGPLGHLLETTAVGRLPENPWHASRGRKPYADLRFWMVREARRWRARCDGAAGSSTGSAPAPGAAVRVLVGAADDWRVTARTLRALERTLLELGPELDPALGSAEVAVVDDDRSASTAVMLEALVLALTARTSVPAQVVRGDVSADWVHQAGRRVFLAAGVQPQPGWLTPLLQALDEPGVGVVAPLLLAPDGTIRSAGIVGQGRAAYDLLAGHPSEDAVEVLAQFTFADIRRSVVAVDHLPVQGAPRLCPASKVMEHDDVGAPADLGELGAETLDLETLDRKTLDPWAALGFEVVAPGAPPRVRRPRVEVSPGVPRLRWALRIASPAGLRGDAWGDTHFAESLATALRAKGQEVVVDRREAFERHTTALEDVALVLRGLVGMRPVPGALNLCWVISHPELLDEAEASSYDRLLAASTAWSRDRSRRWGIEVEPMLQATDPTLFAPAPTTADTGHRVLFVGSSRGVDRRIVTDAVAAELPLAVYGPQWEGRIPPGIVRGTYLRNDSLGAAYGAAGVVLNDHWDDMRAEGFLSNRLFDAVASGARVVSDPVVGLGDTFGRSVQTYTTPADLARLCNPARYDEHFGDLEERLATAERVRREHSFAARAERLVALAAELGARAGAGAGRTHRG